MKVPPVALAPAFAPALVVQQGVDLAGRAELNVTQFHGAVSMLDYFAVGVLHGIDWNEVDGESDAALDEVTAQVWRVAASFLRTRPQPPPPPTPDRNGMRAVGGDS